VGDISRDTFETGMNVYKSVSNLSIGGMSRSFGINSGKGALQKIINNNDKKLSKYNNTTVTETNQNSESQEKK